jgi:Flp pilus assembly protein TadG
VSLQRRRRRADEGGFATLEFVVLFPLVLFAIALVLQLSLWGYRRSVAIATAQDMAADAAVRGNANSEFLQKQLTNHGLGGLGSLATSVSVVSGTGGSDWVQVVLDGSMPALIGPFTLPIHAVASAPVERFRA